jgi:hypothetical protein
MELKNAHVEVSPATKRAVVEGRCPSCDRRIRKALGLFKQAGYLCECGATVTPPGNVEELLAAAITKAEWRRKMRPADSSPVNLTEPDAVRYWMNELGCTAEELRTAVREMGDRAGSIREYFRKRKPREKVPSADLIKAAIETFKRHIEFEVGLSLHDFHTATGTFPTEVRIRFGPMISILGVERPKIDVEVVVAET